MDELVYGVFRAEGIAYHQRVIGRMQDQGCDGVVLGCTGIPLIINDGNAPLPALDSTRLLARAALRRAMEVRPRRLSGRKPRAILHRRQTRGTVRRLRQPLAR